MEGGGQIAMRRSPFDSGKKKKVFIRFVSRRARRSLHVRLFPWIASARLNLVRRSLSLSLSAASSMQHVLGEGGISFCTLRNHTVTFAVGRGGKKEKEKKKSGLISGSVRRRERCAAPPAHPSSLAVIAHSHKHTSPLRARI